MIKNFSPDFLIGKSDSLIKEINKYLKDVTIIDIDDEILNFLNKENEEYYNQESLGPYKYYETDSNVTILGIELWFEHSCILHYVYDIDDENKFDLVSYVFKGYDLVGKLQNYIRSKRLKMILND